MDVWGPAKIQSINGNNYYLSIMDAYSKFVWIYPLQRKYDVHDIFIQYKKMIELQLNTKIKQVQTD